MQSTRSRIMHILKTQGQVTVDELSQELGLTAVTVRHHLDILRGEGLIAEPLTRRRKSPGRPKHVYTLSEKGSELFPKRYDELVNYILEDMRSHYSQTEVNQMMKRIGKQIAKQASISRESDFGTRFINVVEFLEQLGYMPQWNRRNDGTYMLQVVNCPYEHVSNHNDEVCALDLALLTHLLGILPQRITSSAQGARLCTYTITPPHEE